jgi:hypothetical protein
MQQPENTLATEAAARETVNDYFTAIYAGDTQRLAHVFSPAATLIGWDEGELKCVTRDRWFAFVETIPSPRSQGAPLDSEILQVDVFGTAAVAKVREVYRDFEYVEFLSLLWTGKRWQIVNKCYHQFKPEISSSDRERDAQ